MYTELPGIEVQNEDAVMCAEEQITSRVKPTPKTQYRPEVSQTHPQNPVQA